MSVSFGKEVALVLYTRYVRFLFLILSIACVLILMLMHFLRFPSRALWRIAKFFARWLLFPMMGVRIETVNFNRIPRKGPVLIIGNHRCFLDQFILFGVLPFPYFATLTYDTPQFLGILRAILPKLGFIQIQKGMPITIQSGLETIRTALQNEGTVLMLPEENPIPMEKGFGQFKRGCGIVLRETVARVVFIHIVGSNAITPSPYYMSPSRVQLITSEPFEPKVTRTDNVFQDSCEIANTLREEFIRFTKRT